MLSYTKEFPISHLNVYFKQIHGLRIVVTLAAESCRPTRDAKLVEVERLGHKSSVLRVSSESPQRSFLTITALCTIQSAKSSSWHVCASRDLFRWVELLYVCNNMPPRSMCASVRVCALAPAAVEVYCSDLHVKTYTVKLHIGG